MDSEPKKRKRSDADEDESSINSQEHSKRIKERSLFDFIRFLFRCNEEDEYKQTYEDIVDNFNIYKENEIDLFDTLSSDILLNELPETEPELPDSGVSPRPSTMIVNISTHGGIVCKRDGTIYVPIKTTVPDGMELIKFTLATEGVEGYTTPDETNFYISVINHYMDNLLTNTFDDVDLEILVKGFKFLQDTLKKDIMESIKLKDVSRSDGMKFIRHYEKGYNVFKLRSGDEIANKIFTRKYSEKDGNEFAITEVPEKIKIPDAILSVLSGSSIYSNSIYDSCPQFEILPDVLSRIDPSTDKNSHQSITLEQLMNYYKNAGINRLIVFDFTCSVFLNKLDDGSTHHIEPTKIANLRKRMNTIPTGRLPYGGKTKKKNLKRNKSTRNSRKRNKTQKKIKNKNKNKKFS
jgi:hypothetical protein